MPGPALGVNKEAAEMLVRQVGVQEAHRQTGIPLSWLKKWSAKEGWCTVKPPQMPKSMLPKPVTIVTTPAQALANTLEEDSQACKTHALRYAKRTLKHAADLAETAPDEALTQAPNVASVTKTASMAGAWGADRADVRINVFSDSSRVIDVESLPSAGDERE